MAKKIAARDEHITGDTHDHAEVTATDKELEGSDNKKRGLDVSSITPIELEDESKTDLREIRLYLKRIIFELQVTNKHLALLNEIEINVEEH